MIMPGPGNVSYNPVFLILTYASTASTISVNMTYIQSNLNLNSLSVSSPLSLTSNPYNPSIAASTLSITLSSLTKGNGIILSTNPWNPASTASTISVDMNYINSNINVSAKSGSLNASSATDINLTPNPWNPLSGTNANIDINSYGFMAFFSTTKTIASAGIVTPWKTTAFGTYSYNSNAFNTISNF